MMLFTQTPKCITHVYTLCQDLTPKSNMMFELLDKDIWKNNVVQIGNSHVLGHVLEI